jgi:hypothetical protein
MSAKYAKPYSAEDRAPKSVVFDLLTPPTAAEPDVHPALVSRATATLNIDSLHGRDTSVTSTKHQCNFVEDRCTGKCGRVKQIMNK